MKPIKSLKDDLQAYEEDKIAIKGLLRYEDPIISPKGTYLDNNPRQATILMLKEISSRANCRKFWRQYNMTFNTLARIRKKVDNPYYSNLLETLTSNRSRNA
jgi:hypothetical protein